MELELSLAQKQILSQRMQLSVKILQMNSLDLEWFIQQSALENPLIELEMPEQTDSPALTRIKKLEWLNSVDESNSYQHVLKPDRDEQDMPLYHKHTADSLEDVLVAQLPDFRLSGEQERLVRYLIANMDGNGYINTPQSQLLGELDVDEARLSEAFHVLHRMDPPGVGAADLRECLLIQARRQPDASPVLLELIEHHLDMLAKNQLLKLSKALRIPIEDVKAAREQLLLLNPKPGNGYSTYNAIPYIRPDLFVVRFEKSFQVILNDYNQPKIEINSYYRTLSADNSAELAKYIDDKLSRAEWLINCIQQRRSTILKCAGSILRRQMAFFELGPGNLAPMTLADVADDLDVHPSTVSRAARGKYLQCQWGVFGLGDFFSRSICDSGDADCADKSRDNALMQIKRIIAEEDPAKPLSDQEIAQRLQKLDIGIARRTVAKYREQLGLPPASGRKKF